MQSSAGLPVEDCAFSVEHRLHSRGIGGTQEDGGRQESTSDILDGSDGRPASHQIHELPTGC